MKGKPNSKFNLRNCLIAFAGLAVICLCLGGLGAYVSNKTSTPQTAALPDQEEPFTPSPPPTITPKIPQQTSTPHQIPTLRASKGAEFACIPSSRPPQTAEVVEIVDGDTIQITINGQTYPLRYIGIDSPEISEPDTGPAAAKQNAALVMGKTVLLYKDVSDVDQYGRLLRYVVVDDTFVNYQLVANGYAKAVAYPPDVSCHGTFADAQQTAAQAGLGLWAIGAMVSPTFPAAVVGSCPDGCLEEQPGCSIKGNINSEGEKIYHVPGSRNYDDTKIDPSKGERWFCTVDEAVANGWRAPRN